MYVQNTCKQFSNINIERNVKMLGKTSVKKISLTRIHGY